MNAEGFRISATYYLLVTGELDKAIETYELWAKTYPRSSEPYGNLGALHLPQGSTTKRLSRGLADLRLNPGALRRSRIWLDYMLPWNALTKLKEAYRDAVAHKIDNPFMHGNRYGVAFLENDLAEMRTQVAAVGGKSGEDILLSFASDTEAFYGHIDAARRFSARSVASAVRGGSKETAAAWQMDAALREAEFINVAESQRDTALALADASTRDVKILAALALARVGDAEKAKHIADELAESYPLNTVINHYWLPTIYASIEVPPWNAAASI